MNKLKIFIAAPISGFNDIEEYNKYRDLLLNFINFLRKEFNVYSEIEKISNTDCYDDPKKSVINDFDRIQESDILIFYHPKRMQTSTLVEFGYAFAKNKKIIIIANPKDLPYLMQGISDVFSNVMIIESANLNEKITKEIVKVLKHT